MKRYSEEELKKEALSLIMEMDEFELDEVIEYIRDRLDQLDHSQPE